MYTRICMYVCMYVRMYICMILLRSSNQLLFPQTALTDLFFLRREINVHLTKLSVTKIM
jgi:hypothetical protein